MNAIRSWRGVESLEPRVFLSLMFGADAVAAEGKGGGAPAAPAFRLDLVALHELGHSLGLQHNNDQNSIMYPYYNSSYDMSYFTSGKDPAVQQLEQLFSAANVNSNSTAWKNSLDGSSTDHVVDVTYSFVLDGARMDKGTSTTFATFDGKFGAGNWESIFATALADWASVSGGIGATPTLSFAPFNGGTGIEGQVYAFGISGSAQHDSRFGDIRIATHRFDGVGKTLAHTYYPPPNGGTAAGDSHYDDAENWVKAPSGASVMLASAAPALGGAASASAFASDAELIGTVDDLF